MSARRRIASIALAIVAGIGVLLALDPQGQFSREAIGDFFFVRLPRNLAEAGTPLGGERVLPPPVQHMMALLRAHQVERYRISPRIFASANGLFQQRVLEGAWPIQLMSEAPWYLAYGDEVLPAQCLLVDRQEDVVLARCP